MHLELTTWRWHSAIIKDAERKLGRRLQDYKKQFIKSRSRNLALEMIHDTVKAANKDELAAYLGSEWQPEKQSER
jgi:hypothetical protein